MFTTQAFAGHMARAISSSLSHNNGLDFCQMNIPSTLLGHLPTSWDPGMCLSPCTLKNYYKGSCRNAILLLMATFRSCCRLLMQAIPCGLKLKTSIACNYAGDKLYVGLRSSSESWSSVVEAEGLRKTLADYFGIRYLIFAPPDRARGRHNRKKVFH